jgi:hypothetical protein
MTRFEQFAEIVKRAEDKAKGSKVSAKKVVESPLAAIK